MLTTILIITFKNDKTIHKLLNRICNHYKIIIIENSDNINLKKNLEKKYKNLSCILTYSNLGFSRACNIGLKKIKTKYTLLLNSDIDINYLKIKKIENIVTKIDDFGIIAPNCSHTKDYLSSNHDKFSKVNNFYKRINNDLLEEVDRLPGFCLFLKMQHIKKIKYFDEKFFFYFEDLDLCKRLKIINKKIYLIRKIFIKHNADPKSTMIMREWHFYWGLFYYHRKHYGYFIAAKIFFGKMIRFFILKNINFLYNKKKYLIYSARFNGLFNQFLNRNSNVYKKFYNSNKILVDNWKY
jgi:GT2 family glycosyltransferase